MQAALLGVTLEIAVAVEANLVPAPRRASSAPSAMNGKLSPRLPSAMISILTLCSF
ncbi:hypothetical protein [Massilia sp. TWR1-2-2]|uniref:hypothetical protein n=1 Tax=Massilia sp. TWR1-2-2 TaxID=2804584 RepID=UPI003CE6F1FC